jgi:hypothetical protein
MEKKGSLAVILFLLLSNVATAQNEAPKYNFAVGYSMGMNVDKFVFRNYNIQLGKNLGRNIYLIAEFNKNSAIQKAKHLLDKDTMDLLDFTNNTPGGFLDVKHVGVGIQKDVMLSSKMILFLRPSISYDWVHSSTLGKLSEFIDGEFTNKIRSVFASYRRWNSSIYIGLGHEVSKNVQLMPYAYINVGDRSVNLGIQLRKQFSL